MSDYQSKGDQTEAQLKAAGRIGGNIVSQRGGSFPPLKGGGTGGPNPSAIAPQLSVSAANHVAGAPCAPQPRPSLPAEKGKAIEPTERGTSGGGFDRSFSSQPPRGLPQQQLSARLPSSKHDLKQIQTFMEVPRSAGQPAFSLQFGTISPGFMHDTGLQIPARTSSAPPNLDEQKREKAQFDAACASATTKSQSTVPSRSQEVRVPPHLPPQLPPASSVSPQVRPQVHLQPAVQLVEAQSHLQQARVHQHVPRLGLVHNQGPKFSQPINPPQHSGQMLTPHVTHPIPVQFNQQRPPQISHQLGPQASGPIGAPLRPPVPQYGPPSQHIRPRTNRAVKIVDPNTNKELVFDSKMKKNDMSADKVLPLNSPLAARLSNNGPAQPRVGVPFASAPHHQMNINFFPGVQVGTYGPSVPPFYRPALQTNCLPSAGAGLPSNPSIHYGFATPQGMPYMNHSVASGSTMSPATVVGMGLSGPEHVLPDKDLPMASNLPVLSAFSAATQPASKLSLPPNIRPHGTSADQGSHDLKEKGRFEVGALVQPEHRALNRGKPDTLTVTSVEMPATTPHIEVVNQEQKVPAEVLVNAGTKQSQNVVRKLSNSNSVIVAVANPVEVQVEAKSSKGLKSSIEVASLVPSLCVSPLELRTVSSTSNDSLQSSNRTSAKENVSLATETEKPSKINNATKLGFDTDAAIVETKTCSSNREDTPIPAPYVHLDAVEIVKNTSLLEQASETPDFGDLTVCDLVKDHLTSGDKNENSHESFPLDSMDKQLIPASEMTQEKEQPDNGKASMEAGAALCPAVGPVAETFVNEQPISSLVSDPSSSFEKNSSNSDERVSDPDSQDRTSFTNEAHQTAEPNVGNSILVEHLENSTVEDSASSIHFDQTVSSLMYPLEMPNLTNNSSEEGNGLDNTLQELEEANSIGMNLGLPSTFNEVVTNTLSLPEDPVARESSIVDSVVNKHTNSRSHTLGDSIKIDAVSIAIDGTLCNYEYDNDQICAPAVGPITQGNEKDMGVFAKADTSSVSNDLYNVLKTSKEVKPEEIMQSDRSSTELLANEVRKDIIPEKVTNKELDDWDGVAESKERTDAIEKMAISDLSGNASKIDSLGSRKYTRDFLLSFRELCIDFPVHSESRATVPELFLNPEGVQFRASADSGRNVDRQPNSSVRPERRSSVPDEDKWKRHPGIPSPSVGYTEVHMDMGVTLGFRPGQNLNMVPRPGIRPGMPMQSSSMMGLIPGAALGNQMMGNAISVRMNGVDADRWGRAPAIHKGIIPSPYTPLPTIHKSENRYEVGKVSDEEAGKQRQIKSILNKLTPQNFDKLFEKVKEVHIESANALMGVISQIFDKALFEPTFCEMYAKFCVQLSKELPEFIEDGEKVTFKRVLLNKCQEEFERGEREQEEAMKLTDEEREEKRLKARRRMLGNIRFIGELYKENMLTERIMHECIKKLLGGYQNPDEEDIEALCKLMGTIGRIIDHVKAKHHMNTYFDRMSELAVNEKLSSRLRFMLRDVIDLRKNGWQERRKVEGPKKIEEVHRDAAHERQIQSGRDRFRGVSMGGVNRRLAPPVEFGMRGPPSPQYSAAQSMGNFPVGGVIRSLQPQTGIRNTVGQDVRMEARSFPDSRPLPMTLSQRPADEGSITLVPQGGLGRGLYTRAQPSVPGRSALADLSSALHGDSRGSGVGPLFGFLGGIPSDRGSFVGTVDHLSSRNSNSNNAERVDRPLLDRPLDRSNPTASGRDLHGFDRSSVDRTFTNSSYVPAPMSSTRQSAPVSEQLNEGQLREKSELIITEYFSARDMREAAQCVDELKAPKFHSTMICDWVSKSLERKDADREYLVKLLLHLSRTEPPMLSNEAVIHGFDLVLGSLEDTSIDVPRAPEYVAVMLGKLIVHDILSLPQVCKLLKYGGLDPGSLIESGDSLKMWGSVLETLRQEKGESDMVDAYKASGIELEDFVPRRDKKGEDLNTFLREWNLQCLSPIAFFEEQLRKSLEKNQEAIETHNWFEKNVPLAMFTDGSFPRMVMTQILWHCIPSLTIDPDMNILKERTRKYARLLRMFSSGNTNVVEDSQRQYIVAVQLFVNNLGHPPGLMTMLFDSFYHEEVISERAYTKWQDDVKDSTPGRDKAIREVGKWLAWLATAPEEAADDN